MRRKNNAKDRRLHTIAQLCWAIFSHLRHVSIIAQNLLNSNISFTCPHNMVNFSRQLASLEHPSKFWQVSPLRFVAAQTLLNGGQLNFARCLAVSWAGTPYTHYRGLLSPNGILPGAIALGIGPHSSLILFADGVIVDLLYCCLCYEVWMSWHTSLCLSGVLQA